MSTHAVSTPTPSPATRAPLSLPAALRLDGRISGAVGLVLLVAAAPLESALGIDAVALRIIGAFLLVWMLELELVARHPRPALVWPVMLMNDLWVLASAGVLAFGWFSLTTAGVVVVVAQALAVAAFTILQLLALREPHDGRARPRPEG